jgi:hypothetical protein
MVTDYQEKVNLMAGFRTKWSDSEPDIPPSSMEQRNLQIYTVPLTSLVVHDAPQTKLPNPSATDDLGIYLNTWATGSPSVKTYDVKTVGATALYALFEVTLPPNYVASETVQVVITARTSAAADTSCTLDLVIYRSDGEAGIGSDLCNTAAQNINSASWADFTYEVTDATLGPGDTIWGRLHVAVNDGAGGSPVQAEIGKIELQCDTQGG